MTDKIIYHKYQAGLSLMKPMIPGNASENQDQPSPISVLEPPFEEDDNLTRESSSYVKPDDQGNILSSVILVFIFTQILNYLVLII